MALLVRPLITFGLFAMLPFLAGCPAADTPADAKVAPVKISGKTFFLEIAADPETRFRGLSGRTHIESDGGMIFVFPPSEVQVHKFVMRDCPIPIDIIYCDGAGRVLTTYTMAPEPERTEAEKVLTGGIGIPEWGKSNQAYEDRLKKYSSRYPSQIVIELKGGSLDTLKVREGDLIQFDAAGLKKRAK